MADHKDEKIAELEDMLQQLHERLHVIEQKLSVIPPGEEDILFGDGWVDGARKAAGWVKEGRKGARG